MRYVLITIVLLFTICGCSSHGGGILPDEEVSDPLPQFMLSQSDRYAWDIGLYRVSEDHMNIERLPNRATDWHINVNYFVEPPFCNHCLMVGKPQIQPDGTIKVKVILSHPFPGQPQYTGFDVRGTIMFPATRYWEVKGGLAVEYNGYYYYIYHDKIPLNFSRAEDGGGQLLNTDGYTFYLFPGLDYGPVFEQPIFNYSKGQHAHGPDPDSTVNGFKLFTKDPERRMFLTTDTISRTYHIAPPEGEFFFGYVIDASWVQPTTTPVTDPQNDFPFWANCEEGYILKTEQLVPFKTGGYYGGYEVTQVTFSAYTEAPMWGMSSRLICPDVAPSPLLEVNGIAHGPGIFEKEGIGVYSQKQLAAYWTYNAPPGEYLALMFVFVSNYYPGEQNYPHQIMPSPLIDFIYLEVVQGD